MDIVRLRNIRLFAHHGSKSAERSKGQWFEIDVELHGCLKAAAQSDDLGDTFDFDKIYEKVAGTAVNTRFNLMETLGEEICSQLKTLYPDSTVKLVIRKPDPPIDGMIDSVEIEMIR